MSSTGVQGTGLVQVHRSITGVQRYRGTRAVHE
jgi:hypothetical protein